MRWLTFGLFLTVAGCASGVEAPVVLADGEGLVRVRCMAQQDGRLKDCEVVSERPAGHGFGEQALRMAGQARLDPDVLRGESGSMLEYTMRFRLDDAESLDLPPPRA